MTREDLFEALKARARELGWAEAEVIDDGALVEVLVAAPGAADQSTGPVKLSQARKVVGNLGGPELYPAIEEYDTRAAEAEVALMEIAEEERAARDAQGEAVEEWPPAVSTIHNEAELHEALRALKLPTLKMIAPKTAPAVMVPVVRSDDYVALENGDGLYTAPNGGLSPKETWQAGQNDLQDRGGVPHIGQLLVEEEPEPIEEPEPLKEEVIQVARHELHKVLEGGITVVKRDDRYYAPEGFMIKARLGAKVFLARTLSTSYREAGWALSLVRA